MGKETNANDDLSALSKAFRGVIKKNPYETIYENYMNDVEEYLHAKLPDVDVSVIKEIAIYCATRMWVPVQDVMFQRDKDWRNEFDRIERKSKRELKGED